MIASTPANGPRPTTLTQMSAQISVSTPRTVSQKRRVKTWISQLPTTLRAARKASGNASTAAPSVPANAIATVCASACR